MIPQNIKDILGHVGNSGFWNTLVLILFILVFVFTVYLVVNKPKKYYEEEENAPLNDGENEYNSYQ